jgi:hypothetical protein
VNRQIKKEQFGAVMNVWLDRLHGEVLAHQKAGIDPQSSEWLELSAKQSAAQLVHQNIDSVWCEFVSSGSALKVITDEDIQKDVRRLVDLNRRAVEQLRDQATGIEDTDGDPDTAHFFHETAKRMELIADVAEFALGKFDDFVREQRGGALLMPYWWRGPEA